MSLKSMVSAFKKRHTTKGQIDIDSAVDEIVGEIHEDLKHPIEDPHEYPRKCEFSGSVDDYVEHLKICPLHGDKSQCPDCNISLPRYQLSDHQQTCGEVVIGCPNGCESDCFRKYLSSHLKACPNRVVPCRNRGCVVKCLRKDFRSHLKNCEMRIVKCPFLKMGCRHTGAHKLLTEHLQTARVYHLELKAHSQDIQIAELKQMLSQQNSRIDRLLKSPKDDRNARRLTKLERKVNGSTRKGVTGLVERVEDLEWKVNTDETEVLKSFGIELLQAANTTLEDSKEGENDVEVEDAGEDSEAACMGFGFGFDNESCSKSISFGFNSS